MFVIHSAMGINQHHDGLTGTEKQHVANDYSFLLANATESYNAQLLFPILKEQAQSHIKENLEFAHYNWNNSAQEWNLVYKQLQAKKSVVLTVYNPGLDRTEIMKIKIPKIGVNVIDVSNKVLVSDIICANKSDANNCDLYFQATLQNYSLNYFKLVPSESLDANFVKPDDIPFFAFSKTFKLTSTASLKVNKFNNKLQYTTTSGAKNFELHFNYYKSFQAKGSQASGAYIFRPQAKSTHSHSILYSLVKSKEIYIGKVVSVLHLDGIHMDTQLRFNSLDQDFIEVENHIKPISIHDDQGKEIVVVYAFDDIKNNDIWYTDSNGLETQQRIRNKRPTYTEVVDEPSAGNYYPINMFTYLEDPKT